MFRAATAGPSTPIEHYIEQQIAEETDMNQLHPEWGPARHDPEDPSSPQALQAFLDQRDADGPRPDDN